MADTLLFGRIEGSLIVFGVMLSYWLDLGFSFLEPSTISWRFPIA